MASEAEDSLEHALEGLFHRDRAVRQRALYRLERISRPTGQQVAVVLRAALACQVPIEEGASTALETALRCVMQASTSVLRGSVGADDIIALGALARRLRHDDYAWVDITYLLCEINTPLALKCWAELFTGCRQLPEMVKLAAMGLEGIDPRSLAPLFPALLAGMGSEAHRGHVIRIAQTVFDAMQPDVHPLAGCTEQLVEIVRDAIGEPSDMACQTACLACRALCRLDGARPVLEAALRAASTALRIAAAWGLAELGDLTGIPLLVDACRSPRTLAPATEALRALGREHDVPEAARSREALAIARVLAASDSGLIPETGEDVAVVDSRELAWPPHARSRTVHLVQYDVCFDRAFGDVFSVLHALGPGCMTRFLVPRALASANDLYAITLTRSLDTKGQLMLLDTFHPNAEQHALKLWHGPSLDRPWLLAVVLIGPRLHARQRVLGVVHAELEGEPGYAIVAEDDSEWIPEECAWPFGATDLLYVAVGRMLLGLGPGAEEPAALRRPEPLPPSEHVERYERYVRSIATGVRDPDLECRDVFRMLLRQSHRHVESLVALGRHPDEQAAMRATYESILAAVRVAGRPAFWHACVSGGPLVGLLEPYVDALADAEIASHRRELTALIRSVARHLEPEALDSPVRTALRIGAPELAGRLLETALDGTEDGVAAEITNLFLEHACRIGRPERGVQQVQERMQRLLRFADRARPGDRFEMSREYADHVAALTRFAPDLAAREMRARGLPEWIGPR